MARRTAAITVTADGRDKGKVYHLHELGSVAGERWFMRAMQMLIRSGVDVPPNILEQGAMGFVTLGIGACLTGLGKAPHHEYEELMDQMLPCIVGYQEVTPDGKLGAIVTNIALISDQTEEIATWFFLREQIVSLHLGFSLAAKLQSYREAVAALINTLGLNTAMSPEVSPLLSPDA